MLLVAHCILTFVSLGALVVCVRSVGRCELAAKQPKPLAGRRVLHGLN